MKTQTTYAAQFLLDILLEQFIHYLIVGWGLVIFIGNFTAAVLITLGLISWLSGWNSGRTKQMVVGGIILFIMMLWMAFNPPWLPFLI